MRILVAEDDPVSRRALEVALVGWGYDVVSVCDGVEAWQTLQSEDTPSMVILDWIMPGMMNHYRFLQLMLAVCL